MVNVLERLSRFYMSESCGQCTPCREGTGWLNRMLSRIMAGQGDARTSTCWSRSPTRSKATPSARWATPRRGRCRASSSTYRHEFEYMIDHGGRSIVDAQRDGGMSAAPPVTPPAAPPSDVVNVEVDGEPVQAQEGRDDHPRHRRARRLRAALLLPRQAAHRGQLPHVPGRGGEGAQADAGLRHAGDGRHEDPHPVAEGHRGPEGDDGVPADQSSAGLPDLRPGRRVRAAGSGHGLRPRHLALQRAQARREGQEPRTAGLHRHDALHPLHALRALHCRRSPASRSSAPPVAASTWRSARTSNAPSITSSPATSSTCARWAR